MRCVMKKQYYNSPKVVLQLLDLSIDIMQTMQPSILEIKDKTVTEIGNLTGHAPKLP